MHLYADNTALGVTAHNVEELETKLNRCLHDADTWMKKNHLTLNADKTKFMTFGTTHTLSMIGNADLCINLREMLIEQVNDFKYLGVHLDPKLTFTNHVDYVKCKTTSRLRMLGRT